MRKNFYFLVFKVQESHHTSSTELPSLVTSAQYVKKGIAQPQWIDIRNANDTYRFVKQTASL